MTARYAEAITPDEHERIYKAYWRGGFRSISEAARQTGHAIETVKDLVERVPAALLKMPERMTPEDRVRWCLEHRVCLVCARGVDRKNARICSACVVDWRYCGDCGKPLPVDYFYDSPDIYCKKHVILRRRPNAAFRRRTPEQRAQDLAAIEQLRADGKTWAEIAAIYNCKSKALQQRYATWKKASEDATA